jgi:hypothetical protein
MKLKQKNNLLTFAAIAVMMFFQACNSGNNQESKTNIVDTTLVEQTDTNSFSNKMDSSKTTVVDNSAKAEENNTKKEQSVVLIYNFHVTNRCASCIAIEEATTKTLNTYFSAELKSGRIKRQILNVDDEANAKISEKYQAFGSGMFVTRIFKGKETTTDLTGDGFKFAKNKEERFIEILKSKITEYLK